MNTIDTTYARVRTIKASSLSSKDTAATLFKSGAMSLVTGVVAVAASPELAQAFSCGWLVSAVDSKRPGEFAGAVGNFATATLFAALT